MSFYSTPQQIALALMPKLSGSVSTFCGGFIIHEILSDFWYVPNGRTPMKRALLLVSLFEIADAFGWFLSSWAMPADIDFVFTSGTQGTCSFQGFLLQLAVGGPLNTGLLTYLFYHVVKNNGVELDQTTESRIRAVTILFPIGTAFLMLFLGQYNATNLASCWIMGQPMGCGNSWIIPNADVPCDRGDHAYIFALTFFYIPLWIMFGTILYLNASMRNMLIKNSQNEDAAWVTTQALMYGLAFFVTWTPSTLSSVLSYFNVFGFWFDIASTTMEPLLGLWNMLIFVRNRPDSIAKLQRIFSCGFYDDDSNIHDQDQYSEEEQQTGICLGESSNNYVHDHNDPQLQCKIHDTASSASSD